MTVVKLHGCVQRYTVVTLHGCNATTVELPSLLNWLKGENRNKGGWERSNGLKKLSSHPKPTYGKGRSKTFFYLGKGVQFDQEANNELT